MAVLSGGSTVGGQPIIHLGNLKRFLKQAAPNMAAEISSATAGLTAVTVGDALLELQNKKADITTSISAGAGLTGGGTLGATRTLSVSFAGTGSASTVARSDHNHDTRYVTTAGDSTITGVLTLNELQFGTTGRARMGGTANKSLILSGSGENVYLRPSGNTDATGELIVSASSVTHAGVQLANVTYADTKAPKTTLISPGAGLTGGGDLSTNRTLSVIFAGTGANSSVARSDHNHDGTYIKSSGDTVSGLLVFGAGQATSNSIPAVGVPTQGLRWLFGTDMFALFGRQDTVGEVNHLVMQLGDNPNDGFQIEGMDSGSATPVTLFDIDKQNGARFSTDLYANGSFYGTNIYENGTLLSSRYALLSTSITAGAGLTGGGSLAATRTLSVSFAGTGSASTVARSDHTHSIGNMTDVNIATATVGQVLRHNGSSWVNAFSLLSDNSDVTITSPGSGSVLQHDGSKWVNRTLAGAGIAAAGVVITAGNGLTGGGNLTASRTLNVDFAGTGSAVTASRSDHNHDATYVNLVGSAQTVTSGLYLNGSVVVNGEFQSTLSTTVRNDGTQPITAYSKGLAMGPTSTASGFPSSTGVVFNYYDSASRNFQLFHSKNTNYMYIRTWHDSNAAWTNFSRIMIDSDVDAIEARSIVAGTGLTGGGTLAASRTLNVAFAGSGSATTASRSDHIHTLASLTEDSTHRLITDAERAAWNAKETPAGAQARANTAFGDAVTWARSFGLGDVPANFVSENRDLNTVGNSGFYRLGGAHTNAPVTYAYGQMLVIHGAADTITQMVFPYSSTRIFFRSGNPSVVGGTGSFSAWTELSTVGHTHALNDLSNVSAAAPSAGHTLRYSGSSWASAFPTMNDNSDITLTSPASGHILQHDGTKWVNRTLATAGVVTTSTSITAGAGLTGGGTLAATRSLAVSFAGTGAASTVARSDHTHAFNSLTDVTVASPTTAQTIRYNGTTWVNTFPLLNDTNDVSISSLADGHVLQYSSSTAKWVNRTLASAGIASASTSIIAGAGLNGGGTIGTDRTLSVNFAGYGSSSAAARSDHGHDVATISNDGFMSKWQALDLVNAQKFSLLNDSTGDAVSCNGADLNNLTTSGFYYGNNLTNNPYGATIYHRVWVMRSGSASCLQIAITNGGRLYIRNMTGGTWEAWTSIFSQSNVQSGKISITPVANTPTGSVVSFPTSFKNTPIVFTTASTIVPGTSVTGTGVSDESTTSVKIWVTRTNNQPTTINWFAIDTTS